MVVDSFRDDPVRVREPRYFRKQVSTIVPVSDRFRKIALVVTDRHAIHHVRERGYVESPVRIQTILEELERASLFDRVPPRDFSEKYITAVHDPGYIEYFRRVCKSVEPGKSVYPYVFPVRNAARPPKELAVRAGYYCIDTFTPLNPRAFVAAKRAVDCALTAANKMLEGYRIAYALIRPPGHHAERRSFGGFCYFNNAAIAAQFLSGFGKVAILDLDYHHGNGQQMIFYERSDVLTISIHGHPRFTYPYFSGFQDELGEGPGHGYNVNYPLPEHVTGEQHSKTLEKALRKIVSFSPAYLILCLGLDTAKGDPTGTWNLRAKDFGRLGTLIGQLRYPTLAVQEGGYNTRSIGVNARHFFVGVWTGMFGAKSNGSPPPGTLSQSL
jgi:acetoin utilization deacetylase AcuC-like enzyme